MMKSIKYIFLILLVLGGLFSCSDDILDDINKNPNSPTDVPISLLLPHAIMNTIHGVSGNGAGTYASFFVEHATNVHLNQRLPENVSTTAWNRIYNNLNDLQTIIGKGSEGGSEEGQFTAVGIAKILYAYTLSVGTDLFGDMPHSEALQGSLNRTPAFDDQQTIYTYLQQLLDQAIADLDKPSVGSIQRFDLIFDGNAGMWKKTAYALKARLYNRLSGVDPAGSARDALDALSSAYASPQEGWIFDGYLSGNTNDNPWTNWQKREQTFAVGKATVDLMRSLADGNAAPDPRAERWFTRINGEFVGAPSGQAQSDLTHSIYSAPSTQTVLYDEAPQPMITYDEMKFIEAEANLRLGNRAAANAAYEEAVKEAMRRASVSSEGISAYTRQATVFPGENALALEHIIEQKYLSFWMFQSLEAFNDYRRTGIPEMQNPQGTPLRLPYPVAEVNRNPNTPSEINNVTIYEIPVWWAQH
ncbi:MAG: hypothetical protein ABS46_01225 [Cytophagaceae bacterium SCN 52-12]|nr:MAG: hypothetical protein ABS46_01225 [Cytophagaceae bacterium SCN 52-12]